MKEKKDQKIVIKVTKSEKKRISNLAKSNNQCVSEYARKRLLTESGDASISNNNSLEYVQLINAIDDIEDDKARLEVGLRLEMLLCHL